MLPRDGDQKIFFYARKLCPPLNKSPRTPLFRITRSKLSESTRVFLVLSVISCHWPYQIYPLWEQGKFEIWVYIICLKDNECASNIDNKFLKESHKRSNGFVTLIFYPPPPPSCSRGSIMTSMKERTPSGWFCIYLCWNVYYSQFFLGSQGVKTYLKFRRLTIQQEWKSLYCLPWWEKLFVYFYFLNTRKL